MTDFTHISQLQPDQKNARRHTERNIGLITRSLNEVGAARSIVIDEHGNILAGNGTVEAAALAGIESVRVVEADGNEIVAVRRIGLTEEQKRRLALFDNRSAEFAEWDEQILAMLHEEEPASLKGMWGDEEIERLIKNTVGPSEGLTDPDDISASAEAVTKPGDLWLLGEHMLLCGDSTKPEDVERLMGGERASCIFTDPPYGVAIGAKNRMLNTVGTAGRNQTDIQDDSLTPAQLKDVLLPAFRTIRSTVMADDCTLFVTAPQGGELGMMMMMMLQESGLRVRHVLIWKKNSPTFSMGRLDYDYQHEPILLTWGKKHKRPMKGEHRTSVWEVDKPRKSSEHPTMKPVELYVNAYANNSDPGDNVFDAYCGSGTCLIAAEQLGRRCFAMEISPAYCDVAVKRWEQFTGTKASHSAGA